MTVASTGTRAAYTGNGVTVAFAWPYRFLATTDLDVYVDGVLKTITTHYTVSSPGSSGTVTFLTAPADDTSVVITRATARTQGVDFVANDPFPVTTANAALDRAQLGIQDANAKASRALRAPDYDDAMIALPTRSVRAGNGYGTLAGFDGNGDPTTYSPETPAIVRLGDIVLFNGEFGPCGNGNHVEDMAALDAASLAVSTDAAHRGRMITTRGGLLLTQPSATPIGLRWGVSGNPIHRALRLRSNVTYWLRDTVMGIVPNPLMPPLYTETHAAVDGVTTAFPFNSRYNYTSDLHVSVQASGGTEFVFKDEGVDYTVSTPGETGTVTFDVAPDAGSTVRIRTTSQHVWIFGTDCNDTADAFTDPTIENVAFHDMLWDMGANSEYGWDDPNDIPAFTYAVGATSIRNFRRENNRFVNSDPGSVSRRGRALVLENFADCRAVNDKFNGITQGLYARYGNGWTLTGGRAQGMVEMYDHDGPIDNVHIRDIKAYNFVGDKKEQDVIDFGGGQHWDVAGVTAEDCGCIIGIYRKPHEAPDYETFLNNKGRGVTQANRDTFVPTRDISIRGIHGKDCGGLGDGDDASGIPGGRAMMVGAERTTQTWSAQAAGAWDNTDLSGYNGGVEDVKVHDVTLIDCTTFKCADCKDLQLSKITLVGSLSEDSAVNTIRNAALGLQQSSAGSTQPGYETDYTTRLTGSADTITVIDPQGVGIMMAGVSDSFVLKNPTVTGFNQLNSANSRSGIAVIRNGGKAATIHIENAVVKGGNGSSDALIRVSGLNPSAWVTATAYVRGQTIHVSDIFYTCAEAHTSGTFATDLAAGKWIKSEARFEFIGRPRLEPENGAIPIMINDKVGHRIYPMRQYACALYDTTVATGSATIDRVIDFQGRDNFEALGFQVIPQENVAGDASNHSRLTLFKTVAGVTTELTNLGYVDLGISAASNGVAVSANGVTTNDGTSILQEGNGLMLRITRRGTGSLLTAGFTLVVNGINFTQLST